jgi:hypothetical protein
MSASNKELKGPILHGPSTESNANESNDGLSHQDVDYIQEDIQSRVPKPLVRFNWSLKI